MAIQRIQFRRGTADQWSASDPVLAAGEPGYDMDTGDVRVGDGSRAWSGLSGFARVNEAPPNIMRYGAKGDGSTSDTAAFTSAMAAASTVPGTSIYLPPGRYRVPEGLSMSGYSCGFVADGHSFISGQPTGTVISSDAADRPVLDFTDWVEPQNFRGRVQFSGFAVQGAGVADTRNIGVLIPGAHGGMSWRDVTILETGGPCLQLGTVYLSDFNAVTLIQPVNCETNDVPYLLARGSNGNRFDGIGIMAPVAAQSCPPSGAVRFEDDGTYASTSNQINAMWFENLHPGQGAALMRLRGHVQYVRDTQFFDCLKQTGATETAFIRLVVPAVTDFGGNSITGEIQGRGNGANDIDYGVDVLQSRNSIGGIKGFRGYNVRIAAGVTATAVALAGARSTADWAAVEDNSGNLTNEYSDAHLGVHVRRNRVREDTTYSSSALARFSDTANPKNGGIALGDSGAAIQAVGGNGDVFYRPAKDRAHLFVSSAFAEWARITAAGLGLGGANGPRECTPGAGSPEGVVAAPVGSTYRRTDGGPGTSFYVKEAGTGTTGWVAQRPGDAIPVTSAAQMQAVISAAQVPNGMGAVSLRLPPGTVDISATIVVERVALTLRGAGASTHGTRLRWTGPAGQPMIRFVNTENPTVEDLYIAGSATNVPSAGVLFDEPISSTYGNQHTSFNRVGFGRGEPGTTDFGMDYCVQIAGASNTNNDQFHFTSCQFERPNIACVKVDNSQSIWGSFTNCYFDGNYTAKGVTTAASLTLSNPQFNACTVDIEAQNARVTSLSHQSENSARIGNVLGHRASLTLVGGVIGLTDTILDGARRSFYADMLAGGHIRLDGVHFYPRPGLTERPKVYVRGSSSIAEIGEVSITGCPGLLASDFDIAGGTGFTRKLRVLIQSGDVSVNEFLTGVSAEAVTITAMT